MADNKCSCGQNSSPVRETVCIDTFRVLDSCRDRDCFEDVRCYLTEYGQEIIERTANVRIKCAEIVWACVEVEPIQFNRGFYQVDTKIYCKIVCEACVSPGNVQEFEGIAVVEKKVILYGSEGCVNIFKSNGNDCFCPELGRNSGNRSSNKPQAVLEVVDPIVLSVKVCEPEKRHCYCCCSPDEIPEQVTLMLNGNISDKNDANKLLVTLGFFSVIRIERPAQYLVSAAEYSVPDKECVVSEEDDPCSVFRTLAFPVNEFSPPAAKNLRC